MPRVPRGRDDSHPSGAQLLHPLCSLPPQRQPAALCCCLAMPVRPPCALPLLTAVLGLSSQWLLLVWKPMPVPVAGLLLLVRLLELKLPGLRLLRG